MARLALPLIGLLLIVAGYGCGPQDSDAAGPPTVSPDDYGPPRSKNAEPDEPKKVASRTSPKKQRPKKRRPAAKQVDTPPPDTTRVAKNDPEPQPAPPQPRQTVKPAPQPAPQPTPQQQPWQPKQTVKREPLHDLRPRAACLFEGGAVGHVRMDGELDRDLATYDFEPAGTFGYIKFQDAFKGGGNVPVEIVHEDKRTRMYALAITEATITLTSYTDLGQLAQHTSYLPLTKGARYVYDGQSDDGPYSVTYVLRSQKIGFVDWHYMGELVPMADETIALHFPCPGGFQKGAGGLQFIEAGSIAELAEAKVSARQLFLPLPLTKGGSTSLTLGGMPHRLAIMDVETIEVPAGSFDDCAQIRLQTDDGFGLTFWLAPGVGLIRSVHDEGRVEQLTKYEIP